MLYDAMNEKGLAMSGLAFTGNAKYHRFLEPKIVNYKPYNIILSILGDYESVKHFKDNVVEQYYINIVDEPYDKDTPNAELHWFLSDKDDCLVIESTKDGVDIYDNPFEVMTNNPPFNLMEEAIENNLKHIGYEDNEVADKRFYSRGFETEYLDGSYTSMGRFERLTYLKKHLEKYDKADPITDTFKLCNSVEQLYGLTPVCDKFEYTIYKSVYDLDKLLLYTQKYDEKGFRIWSFDEEDEICRWKL